MKLINWIYLLILSILWGGSFFFIELALRGFPPFTIVFLRISIAAIILFLINIIKGIKIPRNKTIWKYFLIMGLLNNVIPFSLIVSGQQVISSSIASILNASTPFFAIIIAHFFTEDEKLTLTKLFGVISGFLGITILIGLESINNDENMLIGQISVIIAALSYAIAGVYGRRFKKLGIKTSMTSMGLLVCSSLILLPVSLIVDKPWTLPLPG